MVENDTTSDDGVSCDSGIIMLEPRPYRPFKTSEEYLYAMKEDLADWLNNIYNLDINVDNFMEVLETGTLLCEHANGVRRSAEEFKVYNPDRKVCDKYEIPDYDITYRKDAKPGTFFARDNIHNFITWCRKLRIYDCLLFETDDLVLRKNEKSVILCLLEVARRGAKFGMLAPLLVQFEQEIDRDIAKDQRRDDGCSTDGDDDEELLQHGPFPQVVTNDLRSLDEMVRDLVERCSCPSQFPMIKVAEGKYRIGDTKILIYVRILRNHVMVRVGGGWDTLEHYLEKHDPCRCRTGHRTPLSTKLVMKRSSMQMQVEYERSESPSRARRFSTSSMSSGHKQSFTSVSSGPLEHSPLRMSDVERPVSDTRASSRRSSETGYGSLNRSRRDSGLLGGRNALPRSREASLTRLGDNDRSGERQSSSSKKRDTSIPRLRANSGSLSYSKNFPSIRTLMNNCMFPHPGEQKVSGADEVPSGDSGSEVSDEGYKSGSRLPSCRSDRGHCRSGSTPAGYYVDQRHLDVSNLSCDSGFDLQSWEDSIDGIPPASGTPTSREVGGSRIPLIVSARKGVLGPNSKYIPTPTSEDRKGHAHREGGSSSSLLNFSNCKLTRSRSATSENGFCFGLSRDSAGRHSYRSNTPVSDSRGRSAGKNTWNGRVKERGNIGSDLFRNTNKPPSRSSSVSPHPERKKYSSLQNSPVKSRKAPVSLPPSPRKSSNCSISPLIQNILKDPDNDNDEKILMKVETILNRYRASLVDKLEQQGQDVPSELKQAFCSTPPSTSPTEDLLVEPLVSEVSGMVVNNTSDPLEPKDSPKTNYKKSVMPLLGSRIPVPTFY